MDKIKRLCLTLLSSKHENKYPEKGSLLIRQVICYSKDIFLKRLLFKLPN